MPDQDGGLFPTQMSGSTSPFDVHPGPGNGQATLIVTRKPKDDRARVAEKMEEALKLLAEIGEYVGDTVPNYKSMLDDATRAVSEVGLVLQHPTDGGFGVSRVIAPMPGIVMRCEKEVGDVVQKGDTVLILDAMKMENRITAPAGGKIISLPYVEGQKVAKGALIAVIHQNWKAGQSKAWAQPEGNKS